MDWRRLVGRAGLWLVVFVAACVLGGNAVAASKPDKLAAAIEHRLAGAGLTFPLAPVSDYFDPGMLEPETGFYMYACLDSGQPFRLAVAVYKTAAQAATAYEEGIDHVRAIGGDFHAFFMVRSGRVLYMGSTAGGPNPSNPTLPLKAFHQVVGLADGAFWARGNGCGSKSPLSTNGT